LHLKLLQLKTADKVLLVYFPVQYNVNLYDYMKLVEQAYISAVWQSQGGKCQEERYYAEVFEQNWSEEDNVQKQFPLLLQFLYNFVSENCELYKFVNKQILWHDYQLILSLTHLLSWVNTHFVAGWLEGLLCLMTAVPTFIACRSITSVVQSNYGDILYPASC
jgi:hypothetical protein